MTTPSSRREVLEAALVADPDDVATHRAYADLLTEEGDPRGELIAVQLALEDSARPPEERKRLRHREQNLLAAHGRDWLGPTADHLIEGQFRFARGWLDALDLPG